VPFSGWPRSAISEATSTETWFEDGTRFARKTIRTSRRVLTSTSQRLPDASTFWETEPLFKDCEDAEAWLDMPADEFGGEPDLTHFLELEKELGDTGIVMIERPDPLCAAASLFEMSQFTVIALTEQNLFHRLLERFAAIYQPVAEAVSKALPGRLWRIIGPEYAAPPYLPPALFHDYVVAYDTPMISAIQRHGGVARVHCHGRLMDILEHIAATGCEALDPIEPPPQGDVELSYVRERYGDRMTLFGNIQFCDIVNLPSERFEAKVRRAITEGTAGEGRGFVLMPSACPVGRTVTPQTMRNYEIMVEAVGA
jgi:uroporphyrinogen-III decarboxylase